MRKRRLLTAAAWLTAAICILGGCGAETALPDDPIRYDWGVNEEEGYFYLEYEDRRFVPYCAYEAEYLGGCIGYCDIPADEYTEAARVYVFELKGYPAEQWIIEMPELDNCREGMIFREVNADSIPEGLESEYEWNR